MNLKKEMRQRLACVIIVAIGLSCFGCIRPVAKIIPIEKISKKKGKI